jgi:hypothetical protein
MHVQVCIERKPKPDPVFEVSIVCMEPEGEVSNEEWDSFIERVTGDHTHQDEAKSDARVWFNSTTDRSECDAEGLYAHIFVRAECRAVLLDIVDFALGGLK